MFLVIYTLLLEGQRHQETYDNRFMIERMAIAQSVDTTSTPRSLNGSIIIA